ncbi:caspase family protein [Nocardia gipuzkoensis]|uniref:caspase family protein n=1 Tax=Nocardia gipuzkoensis TaxID=2749991 RepID=UPI003EE10304
MAPAPDRVGARVALLVATSSYDDPGLNALRAPAQDVAALRTVLADPRIGGFTVTDVLDQHDYTIRRAIDEFLSGRRVGDVVVVYLSCHGVRDRRGSLYFAAANTNKKLLSSTAIESSWLLNRLDECRARSQVVILDCCFSGAFDRTKAADDIDLERKLVGNSRGRAVLTASRAEEYSYEGVPLSDDTPDAVTGSAFTTGLVKGMADGSADRDGDGYISVEEAHTYAADYVRAYGGNQTPQLWLYGAEGSIILARNPHAPAQLGWQFPAHVRDGLASPHPTIRAAAVRTLGEFLADQNTEAGARSVLKSIAAQDVPEVATVARAVLAGVTTAQETTPTPKETARASTRASGPAGPTDGHRRTELPPSTIRPPVAGAYRPARQPSSPGKARWRLRLGAAVTVALITLGVGTILVPRLDISIPSLDLPLPFLRSRTPVVVDAAGAPPWTVEGYGWKYTVVSVERTVSEWQFRQRPSLTITAYVERTDASDFSNMTFRISDQFSGAALEDVPFQGGGDAKPPLHQRSKLVHVVWDADPLASQLSIALHDFYWPDGRDLILRNVPAPSA